MTDKFMRAQQYLAITGFEHYKSMFALEIEKKKRNPAYEQKLPKAPMYKTDKESDIMSIEGASDDGMKQASSNRTIEEIENELNKCR